MPKTKSCSALSPQYQKAALYIRVSTHWQIDKDSLKVQTRDLIAYCTMILGIDDYEIFEDPGFSAKNTDRPKYQEMMTRMRQGEFTHLLVWKIDRISRNLMDFVEMYNELKASGITFISKNEQFDTSTAIGQAMMMIILVFAELERKMTSERVSAVMTARATDGQWNGGRVPYGYCYDKQTKSFSVDPEKAEIVRQMANKYEETHSLISIVKMLNEQSIPSPSGIDWNPNGVWKILTNTWYSGKYHYNRTLGGNHANLKNKDEWIEIDDHHEPILSEVQQNRIIFRMQRNRRNNPSYQRTEVHIFSGLLRCGLCGGMMYVGRDRVRASGIRPDQFGCANRRRKQSPCTNKYVTDIVVGPFVFNYISRMIKATKRINQNTTPEVLQQFLLDAPMFSAVKSICADGLESTIQAALGSPAEEFRPEYIFNSGSENTEYNALTAQKQKIENALTRLMNLYLYSEAAIPEKDMLVRRSELESQLADVDAKLERIAGSRRSPDFLSDDSLMQKASYLLLARKLTDDGYVDFDNHIRIMDPSIPKNFLQDTIDHICVANARVTAIQFRNGITHTFQYE